MVNVFPDLLAFGLLAPFIIRIFLGAYFLMLGWSAFRKTEVDSGMQENVWRKKILGFIEVVAGLCVIVGFLTQIMAVALAALSLYCAWHEKGRLSYVLLFGMAISLLFSGAGFLALDLPL